MPTTTQNYLSSNLRYLRRGKGFSQQRFSNKIKRPMKRYQSWELANAQPNINDLIDIAKAHDVTIDALLTVDMCAS